MNATLRAQRAYSRGAQPMRTPRSTEYETVARITYKLKRAAQDGAAGFPALVAALQDNRKLWRIFASDVADPDNPLPADLKARIFYLAEFTFQHTSKVLERKASIAPLLDINASILRGLRRGAD